MLKNSLVLVEYKSLKGSTDRVGWELAERVGLSRLAMRKTESLLLLRITGVGNDET